MNRIYKKIFNKARGCFVAVSEVITSASQNGGKTGSALIAGALLALPLTSTAYDFYDRQTAPYYTVPAGQTDTFWRAFLKKEALGIFTEP